MEEQIVKQINDDISKNPNCECYHLRKYFGDKLLEEYSIIRMMETLQDGSIAPGIKDKELIQVLLNRVKTNKIYYTKDNSVQTNNYYRELFIKTLELMLLTFE